MTIPIVPTAVALVWILPIPEAMVTGVVIGAFVEHRHRLPLPAFHGRAGALGS